MVMGRRYHRCAARALMPRPAICTFVSLLRAFVPAFDDDDDDDDDDSAAVVVVVAVVVAVSDVIMGIVSVTSYK